MIISSEYCESIVTPKLSRNIEALWSFIAEQDGSSTVLPDGRCDIIIRFNMDNMKTVTPVITGPATHPYKVTFLAGQAWVGIRLRPDQGALIWKDEIQSAQNHVLRGRAAIKKIPELAAVIEVPNTVSSLETALIDLPILSAIKISDPKITSAIEYAHMTGGRINVSSLASSVSCSSRHLNRMFCASVGLPTKVYCRLVQFHRALRLIKTENLSLVDAAFEAGYSDQAHLTRSIREFSGFAPSKLPIDITRPNLFS